MPKTHPNRAFQRPRLPRQSLMAAVWAIVSLGLHLTSPALEAQNPPEATGTTPSQTPADTTDGDAKDEEITRIIAQLGSDSFRLRESATAKLVLLGPRILPALAKQQSQSDPEMRERIQVITDRIMKDDFEQRINAFLNKDPDSELPGWKYAAQRIPDRQSTRMLYVEMSQNRPGVTGLLEGSNQERIEALSNLTKEIGSERIRLGFTPSLADAILLLMLVTDPAVPNTASDDSQVIFLVRRPEITSRLTDPELSDLLRNLVGKWIVRVNPPERINVLAYSMEHGISDSVTLAKAMLQTDTTKVEPERIQFALMALARFGTVEDIETIKPLLDDSRQTSDEQFYVDPTGRVLKAEVRDEAMAAIGCIFDSPLRSLGFPVGQEHPLSGFAPQTVGFPEGEAGDNARKRVRGAIEELIEKSKSKDSQEP